MPVPVGDRGELVVDVDAPVDLSVAAPGYDPATQTLSPGDEGTLVLVFREGALHDVIEVEAQAPRPASEGALVLDHDELRGVPGADNDALAAVRSMPGVGSSPAVAAGRLVIRGEPPR
ncbi:MAG: hypothetical protein ACM31C_06455, partial [Acidobacteriota bacterium]